MITHDTQYLPVELYSAEQTRELDKLTVEQHGIAGYTLMRRAAEMTWQMIADVYADINTMTVLCGGGNNGGDGYVIATKAKAAGKNVVVFTLSDVSKLQGDALQAYQHAIEAGVQIERFTAECKLQGVIVDAMLGTGLNKAVAGNYALAIEQVNNSGLPVVAVDIPSGLCANSGAELGKAIRADLTCTYIGVNQGLLTANGPACCGELCFDDLAVPPAVYEAVPAIVKRLSETLPQELLLPRERIAHKGSNGHVLIVGGDYGFAGAAAMAAEAAARSGAGLVSVATRPEHVPAIVTRIPELMVHGVRSGQELEVLLTASSVVVIGPGLGTSAWSEQLLQQVTQTNLPLVVDADALNLLAANRAVTKRIRHNWVLTPHPGEAGRLLAQTTIQVQQDRFAAVNSLQQNYGGVAVLKGAGTVIKSEANDVHLCNAGNPGMATGGMGDVLSGVIGSLVAQGLSLIDAANCGVLLHSTAADVAAELAGERGLLATDVIAELRGLVNP